MIEAKHIFYRSNCSETQRDMISYSICTGVRFIRAIQYPLGNLPSSNIFKKEETETAVEVSVLPTPFAERYKNRYLESTTAYTGRE